MPLIQTHFVYRKFICIFLFLISTVIASAQTKIIWEPTIEITRESFKDTPPPLKEDHIQQMVLQATYDMQYQMVNAQFMFTKNFNKYIRAYYIPEQSWIEEGELTDELIELANLQYDAAELYARKFRSAIFMQKSVGSSPQLLQDLHSKFSSEYLKFNARLTNDFFTQENWDEIQSRHQQNIDQQLEELAEFCQSCKPKKRKKKKA